MTMMYEKPLEDAVMLYWHSTPELQDANYYGLREQIIRAYNLDPRRLREVLPSSGHRIIELTGETDDRHLASTIETIRQTHYINEEGLHALVLDLFRQGYLGTGFYIICFNAEALPIETSNP